MYCTFNRNNSVIKKIDRIRANLINIYPCLPIIELAKGKIRDKNTQARLSVEDCFFLATERINGNNPLLVSGGLDYAIAIGWAETALQ